MSSYATCRRCDVTIAGDAVEGLCESCRTARNAYVAQRVGRMMQAAAIGMARVWGGGTVISIREIPSMAVRSTWAVGLMPGSLDPADAVENWRELGDGSYLWTAERDGQRVHAVVDVEDGAPVHREPVTEDEIGALPALYALLEAGDAAVDAAVDPSQEAKRA